MTNAIIISGFYSGSTLVSVSADVLDGIQVFVYDDESKEVLGVGIISYGHVEIIVEPALFSGQRIIAYVGAFGKDTYGSVIVTDSIDKKTGWKTPEFVDEVAYSQYLENGGNVLPDIYSPQECRNTSRDVDAIEKLINTPISFRLKQTESRAGNVQVSVEDIENAFGGYMIKFDSDPEGTVSSKSYLTNGSYKVKVWGVNQGENAAIEKQYTLVMPSAAISFGTNVVDLHVFVDWQYQASVGQKALILYAHSNVACEFKVDGLFDWEGGVWSVGGLSFRSNIKLISAGEYTVRTRNSSNHSEEVSRQIKLIGF
jgi:hypothetical protein